jgi:hypothetical protein
VRRTCLHWPTLLARSRTRAACSLATSTPPRPSRTPVRPLPTLITYQLTLSLTHTHAHNSLHSHACLLTCGEADTCIPTHTLTRLPVGLGVRVADTLDEETRDTIRALLEPVDKFFREKVDSAKIDKEARIPPDVLDGLKVRLFSPSPARPQPHACIGTGTVAGRSHGTIIATATAVGTDTGTGSDARPTVSNSMGVLWAFLSLSVCLC